MKKQNKDKKQFNQAKWVRERLTKSGKVTRNEALKRGITRLASHICQLNNAGWAIEGKKMKNNDYKYFV